MECNWMLGLHIVSGTLALLSGAAALIWRKGSPRHRHTGTVFAVSMLLMSGSGAWMAWFVPAMASVVAGLLTAYMVASSWLAVRASRASGGTSEWLLAGFAVLVATLGLSSGFEALASESGSKHGFPAAIYLIFGSFAALGGLLDLSVVKRGGLTGSSRLARHLWRMCFAMLMATTSFFLGQAKLFPEPLRKTELLIIPVLLVLFALLYWLVRIRLSRWQARPWLRRPSPSSQ